MSKKIFFIICLIMILVGCSGQKKHLTFMVGGVPNEIDYWEKIIKEFYEQSHIKVELIRQPTDTDQRRQGLIIPLRAHKQDPDVFLMDVVWVSQFANSGWLLPLDSFINQDNIDLNNFFRSIVEQVDKARMGIVALPVYNDCGLLYYRKDLLEKYGFSLPNTWDELVSIAQRVQSRIRKGNPDFFGFVWQGAQYEGLVCTFLEFASSFGGGLVDSEGHITINREENIKALRFMRELIQRYKISPPNTYTEMKEEEVRQSFENGNALFERNWPYAWALHNRKDSPVRGKVGIGLLPACPGAQRASALGGWHIGISRYSDCAGAAWKLLKFITSYEKQKEMALNLGWNPGRSDLYEDKVLKERMGHITMLKKAFENSVARPNLPYYTRISEILQTYLNGVISGHQKADLALQNAQNDVEAVIKKYNE